MIERDVLITTSLTAHSFHSTKLALPRPIEKEPAVLVRVFSKPPFKDPLFEFVMMEA